MKLSFLLPFLLAAFPALAKEGTPSVQIRVTADASVAAALREAREMRRLGKIQPQDTLYITLSDGNYFMEEPLLVRPEDSGTPQGPTILRAEHTGKAVLEGGVRLKGWRRPSRQELQGIPAAVHQQLWVCESPRVNGRIVETRQLWQGDRCLPMASLAPLGKLLPMSDFSRATREIAFSASALPADLLRPDFQVTALVHQRWAIALLRVKSMKIKGDKAYLTFLEPESRREFEHPWPQPVINDTLEDGSVVSSSLNLVGSPAFLNQSGEWVQRYPDGLIYYVSGERDGGMPQEPIFIPVQHQLVQVEGILERPVHDFAFEGIVLRHTAWTEPNKQGWVTLQAGFPIVDAYKLQEPGLPEKASLENQAWIGRPQSAVTLRGVERVHFRQCGFRQLGACGVDYVEASSQCEVSHCQFEDIGATALLMGHFPARGFETHVPFRPQVLADLCHDMKVSENVVRGIGLDDWGACAINAGYVYNTTISDNEVTGCPWSGICLGWGWTPRPSGMKNNHLLRNHVSDFGTQLHDCGALYTLSNQPKSSIVGNVLEKMGKAPYATNHRVFYIYLDEATDGFDIRDNQMPEHRIGTNQPGKKMKIQ